MKSEGEILFSRPMQELMKAYFMRHIPNVNYSNIDDFMDTNSTKFYLFHDDMKYDSNANPFTDMSISHLIKVLKLKDDLPTYSDSSFNGLKLERLYTLISSYMFERHGIKDLTLSANGDYGLELRFQADKSEPLGFLTQHASYHVKEDGLRVLKLESIKGFYELKTFYNDIKEKLHKQELIDNLSLYLN